MKNKQLLYLFLCNFAIFFIGTGLIPILPLYVSTRFEASAAGIGLYLGNTNLMLALGTAITGWLADRLPARQLYIAVGVIGIPLVILMGQATAMWQIVILTGLIWFLGGIGLTLSSIFIGMAADTKARGKSFGLVFLAFPIAMLSSGIVVGQAIEWAGYAVMFAILGLFWAIFPLTAYLRPNDDSNVGSSAAASSAMAEASPLPKPFYILLLVTFLLEMGIYGSRLGLALSMESLNFSAGAISSTSIMAGGAAIVFGLMISSYSDRFGRKLFLSAGVLAAAGGATLLLGAGQLWHFWLATALLFVGNTANGAIIPALGTDLLGAKALGRGLSKLSAMTYAAGIVGFVGTGYVIDLFGSESLFAISIVTAG
ncbi:MAG: MFS transporter, partial [Anaerolineae bacterium]|nr:MFS transporter [Anaerolineae bacterium]